MKYFFSLLLILSCFFSFAQQDSTRQAKEYPFILKDSPAKLLSMRQMNQSYLSGSRLLSRGLYASIKNQNIADLLQIGFQSLLLMPLTHEEGHRSVLTAKGIGSVSQPYFNQYGAAYVNGVSDATLMHFRDTDLPGYIRLHTAGLESDYMISRRIETMVAFEQEEFKYVKWEYFCRKLAILQYYLTGLAKFELDLEEEANELDRDIVGYDTYGIARHLFRPNMEFYRYTRYDELSSEEVKFVNRMGFRSLLNLINPAMMGKANLKVGTQLKLTMGMGYTTAPFGDFIDENIWIKYQNLNLMAYARQYQNHKNWFPAFGLSVINFTVLNNLYIDVNGHFWKQPKQYNFQTAESFSGGAIDFDFRYFIKSNMPGKLQGVSIDLGVIYKTEGFLPEELYFEEHFGLRLGTSIRL